jgi:hypothetical protein
MSGDGLDRPVAGVAGRLEPDAPIPGGWGGSVGVPGPADGRRNGGGGGCTHLAHCLYGELPDADHQGPG